MNIFSERLQLLRKEKSLSVYALANEIDTTYDLTYQAIQLWESGRRTPNANAVIALARFFDVSTDYILGETDVRKRYN